MKSLIPPMRFFPLNVSILFLAVLSGGPPANAAIWQSSDYYCQVTLPDGSYVQQWYAMSPANESGALAGARRQDFGAIVYLGVVDVKDKPHFKLDEKSLKELEQGYFGPGLGFLDGTKPISLGGIKGYRLTGRHRFHGSNYAIVVDMYFDHGYVYQVAGLTMGYDNPLQDSDVRAYMQSFRILE